MKLALTSHQNRLAEYLPQLQCLPLSYQQSDCFPERVMEWEVPGATCRHLDHVNLDFFFRYEVFPEKILAFFGEWERHNRLMQVGDIIVQQAQLPPGAVSLKFIFGVRLLTVYREAAKAGFRYGTLSGHAETGTNEFYFKLKDAAVVAGVCTRSAPGVLLTRIVSPFTQWYASFCNRQALQTITSRVLQQNKQKDGGSTWLRHK